MGNRGAGAAHTGEAVGRRRGCGRQLSRVCELDIAGFLESISGQELYLEIFWYLRVILTMLPILAIRVK